MLLTPKLLRRVSNLIDPLAGAGAERAQRARIGFRQRLLVEFLCLNLKCGTKMVEVRRHILLLIIYFAKDNLNLRKFFSDLPIDESLRQSA